MSETCVAAESVEIVELGADESHEMFDKAVRDLLGISREQYLEQLDRGDFDNDDSEDAISLRLMAPFAR